MAFAATQPLRVGAGAPLLTTSRGQRSPFGAKTRAAGPRLRANAQDGKESKGLAAAAGAKLAWLTEKLQKPVSVPVWSTIIVAAVGVVALSTGVVMANEPTSLSTIREKVTLFDYILEDISSSYVEDIDIPKLFETGVNEMLASLDPYTQFENVNQTRDLTMLTTGKYGGVGLVISPDIRDKSKIAINDAFEDYAYKAGMRPGDFIIAVDDTPVGEISVEQVTTRLRGQPGSTVKLLVEREGKPAPFPVTIERASIKVKDVSAAGFLGDPKNGVGYIRLQSFGAAAGEDVREAIYSLMNQRQVKSLVLDLRGNPGGLLSSAVEVSEAFVPRGSVIVSAKGRAMGYEPSYRSTRDPEIPENTPVAVLVNSTTASAAEIVSGAIQDYDLGVLVGTRTFGKGLIQNIEQLPYNTSLKYTVGRYYTPSGRCIQDKTYRKGESIAVKETDRKEFRTRAGRKVLDGGGVLPDVMVSSPKQTELEVALVDQGAFFYFANQYAAANPELPSTEFTITDDIYRSFQKYVDGREDFKYSTRFDDGLSALQKALVAAGFGAAGQEMQDVQDAVQKELHVEFEERRDAIEGRLLDVILSRYQPDSQRIMATLKGDVQVQKAVEVLKDQKTYKQLLRVDVGKLSPVVSADG